MKSLDNMPLVLVLSIFSIFFSGRAEAIEPLPSGTRYVEIVWGGLHVADAVFDIQQKGNLYTVRLLVESRGIAYKIGRYRSLTANTMLFKNGKYIPQSFYSYFELRKKNREITITYSPEGIITQETNIPPENRQKRPAVPDAKKSSTLDPITAAINARHEISGAVDAGKREFSLPVYDGRRRIDALFRIKGKANHEDEEKTRPAVAVQFTLKPVAGFTGNEIKDWEEQKLILDLMLSQDAKFFPYYIVGKMTLGYAIGRLRKECTAPASCMPDDMRIFWQQRKPELFR